jgi:mRNA interferase MazF
MKSGTTLKQRDIVLLPFPYTDLSGSKKRPALVISSEKFNEKHADIICCAITSKKADDPEAVIINNEDLDFGQLMKESKVKPHRLFASDKVLVYKVLGRLNKEKTNDVISRVHEIIPKV